MIAPLQRQHALVASTRTSVCRVNCIKAICRSTNSSNSNSSSRPGSPLQAVSAPEAALTAPFKQVPPPPAEEQGRSRSHTTDYVVIGSGIGGAFISFDNLCGWLRLFF